MVVVLLGAKNVIGNPGSAAKSQLSVNQALAETPQAVSISIAATDPALDGSIFNDLRFSDGRLYRLSLDSPFDMVANKVVYQDIHFRIFVPGDSPHLETLEHGGAAERRVIELLESLIATTQDLHQKKNATSLANFLKNRKQDFPRGKKWWDFTDSAGTRDIDQFVRLEQLKIDDANEVLTAIETKHNTETIGTLRSRVNSLSKSLSEVRTTDTDADKHVTDIDRELTSVLDEIQAIKGRK